MNGTLHGVASEAPWGLDVLHRHVSQAPSMAAGIGTACLELLPVDGAAVVLMSDRLTSRAVSTTDDVLAELEDAQTTVGEGPSEQAWTTGDPVLLPDLWATEHRWPILRVLLPDKARALFCFPLGLGKIRFGTLDLYRRQLGTLAPLDFRRALFVAETASALMLADQDTRLWDTELVLDVPGYDWAVDQATGMTSVHLRVTIEVAYSRLRGCAFASSRPLDKTAREIVAGRLRLDELGDE